LRVSGRSSTIYVSKLGKYSSVAYSTATPSSSNAVREVLRLLIYVGSSRIAISLYKLKGLSEEDSIEYVGTGKGKGLSSRYRPYRGLEGTLDILNNS